MAKYLLNMWYCAQYILAMYIESVPNRNSPPAILLRESFRDGAKIKKRTITNLSDWPAELVEGLRTLLKGGTATPADRESIIVRRALPHGHVAAVLAAVARANLPKRVLGDAATIGAYKSLAQVEQAFRSLKTIDIHLRPIFHWTAPRVRGHVLLCMLAYHVEHQMRVRLAPMLYDETDHEAAAAKRASIVAKAEPSDVANRKQTTGRTADGLPVHSFQTLLADLATYCRIQAT